MILKSQEQLTQHDRRSKTRKINIHYHRSSERYLSGITLKLCKTTTDIIFKPRRNSRIFASKVLNLIQCSSLVWYIKVHSIALSPHINWLLFPRSSDPSFTSRPSLGQLRADAGVSPAEGVRAGAGWEGQSDSDRNTCSCQSDSVTDGQSQSPENYKLSFFSFLRKNCKEIYLIK